MLITSRDTRRWVIPKGNPIKGLPAHRAAEHEAYEEAGLRGAICPAAIGVYRYDKRRKDGTLREAKVQVYPLAVAGQLDEWPEQDERETRWFDQKSAVAAVDEPELKALIADFHGARPVAGRWQRALLWARREGGKRSAMLRWFQALMPKQGRFFEQFEAHAATLVAGADALAKLLESTPADREAIARHARVIFDREQEADDIARDVLQDVRRVLVTPFDRSAITGLIGVMDDAIDQMNQTAKAITLFNYTEFAAPMRDIAAIIVEASRVTSEAIPLLRRLAPNAQRLTELTERLVTIEGHADDIYDKGVKALFEACQDRPMAYIAGAEIYDHLEKVVDKFEDVADEIQGLVIDFA